LLVKGCKEKRRKRVIGYKQEEGSYQEGARKEAGETGETTRETGRK
jgi:hypothetical protein